MTRPQVITRQPLYPARISRRGGAPQSTAGTTAHACVCEADAYPCTGWNTHSYSLDIADDERVAFSIVLIGNQIADYLRQSRRSRSFGRRARSSIRARHGRPGFPPPAGAHIDPFGTSSPHMPAVSTSTQVCSRLTGFTTIGDHLAGEDGYAEDTGGWLFRRPAYWMRLARISPLSMAACSSASLVAARSAKKYGP